MLASYGFIFAEGRDVMFSEAPGLALQQVPEASSLSRLGHAPMPLPMVRKRNL